MILFSEDWNKYPNAIVHTSTNNQSFVRLASVYRSMGVKNHAFPLTLIDPSLEHVNPHSDDLTLEQKALIAIECKQNIWYFLREVIRIPIQGGEPIPYRCNRGNIALTWLFLNHITTVMIQPRQTGKTVSTDSIMTWVLNLGTIKTSVNLLTKDDGLRSKALTNIKEMVEALPEYLCMKSKKDIANTQELKIGKLQNSYLGHLSSKSPKQALNVGRGFTSKIFHIDEGPFIPNIAIAVPAALAAGTMAREIARETGDVFGTIFTTTAGKKDDPDGAYIYNILQSSAIWTERFYDAQNQEILEDIISKSAGGDPRVNCTFNHRQLGFTDEWMKRALAGTMGNKDAAERDFFNLWTAGSQTHPLSIELLEKIKLSKQEPKDINISKENYTTRYYLPQNKLEQSLRYNQSVMSVDTSDGGGGDDISMVITDIKTGKVLVAGYYNELNLIKFAQWLCEWFIKYPLITGVIERRSSAAAIIDYLILIMVENGIDPFKRLFNRVVNEPSQHENLYELVKLPLRQRPDNIYDKHKRVFGFATSGSGLTSRHDLYTHTLTAASTYIGDRISDEKLISQLLGLTTKNGRVDHSSGHKDDMVIAWLLGYWFMTKAYNTTFYGVEPLKVLSETPFRESQEDKPFSTVHQRQQNTLKKEAKQLLINYTNEKDLYLKTKLKHQIKSILDALSRFDRNVPNIDALLENMKNDKIKDRFKK